MPTIATARGRWRRTLRSRPGSAGADLVAVSSAADAVARATKLVIPIRHASSSARWLGWRRTGVSPDAASAGQKRLPPRAKCQPVAAE